ncbi:hypothetical protein K8I28_13105 [bacterium]|nr:hypothetical protein [bacterium]
MKTKRLTIFTLAMVLITVGLSQAQDAMWEDKAEKKWAFELCGFYAWHNAALDDVKDEYDYIKSEYKRLYGTDPSIVEDYKTFQVTDLKMGLRFKNFTGGLVFSNLSEFEVTIGNSGDFTINGNHRYVDEKYMQIVSTKEYLVYIGYVLPLHPRLEIGATGAVGLGAAKASLKHSYHRDSDTDPSLQLSYNSEQSLEGDYNPFRVEGEIRVKLTDYIALSVHGGYRVSAPPDMRGDIIENRNGQRSVYASNAQAEHHLENGDIEELLFDYSGIYYGIGLTLKQPF